MKRTKKIIALILSISMLVGICLSFTNASAATLGQQKDELESQLASIKKEQAAISADLKKAQNQLNNQKQVINLIYDEIDAYQKELETISSLIAEYTQLARQKELEIEELNAEMDRNYQLFKERLIFAQESGSMSYIDFILGSTDLSDIISRTEVIDDMLEYDRKIIQSLVEDKKAIEKAKAEIDVALKNCEDRQTEYNNTLATLEQRRAEAAQYLAQYQDQKDILQAAYNRAQTSKKDIEIRLDKIIQEIANQSQGQFSGTFIWPLPYTSPGYISQYFHSGHSGLDIAVGGWVNNGKIPALAIAAGTVVRIGSYWDWGNLVVVDHGGGYLSYYAHLDSFSVSYGQKVSQGQQVGKIGSTGQSTGPHLHLVIYAPVGANGSSIRTDPMKYISYPR